MAVSKAASPTLAVSTPECALSAGALIVALARMNGVNLNQDGTIMNAGHPGGGAPGTPSWSDLVERVLSTVVIGSEAGVAGLPVSWHGAQDRIAALLRASQDWNGPTIGPCARGRASGRMIEVIGGVGNTFTTQARAVPTAALDPAVDGAAATSARPVAARQLAITAVRDAKATLDVVRTAATTAAGARVGFENRLASPLSRSVFPAHLPAGMFSDGNTATYLTDSLSGARADDLGGYLADPTTWGGVVNGAPMPAANIGVAWAALEPWDGLRGRLLSIGDPSDRALADTLFGRLPAWLQGDSAPVNGDLSAIRPAIAAVAHLGLPMDDPNSRFLGLVNRLVTLTAPGDPPLNPAGMALLSAALIEMKVTVASASAEQALGGVFGGLADLNDLTARLAGPALASAAAWESRAGMNAMILSARLAEVTGEPAAVGFARDDNPLLRRANDLAAGAVATLLSGSPAGPPGSALALALVASDLTRFARESGRHLGATVTATQRRPAWISSPAIPASAHGQPSQLVTLLATRLATAGASALGAFAWQGGRAARSLLLAIFQIRLDDLHTRLRYTVNPLDDSDPSLVEVRKLRTTTRAVFCTERLLLDGTRPAPPAALVPWWRLGYWSGGSDAIAGPPADLPPPPPFLLVNWAASARGDVDAKQLALAAELESAVPPPSTSDADRRDIDGRSAFDLPGLSFATAHQAMTDAIGALTQAENSYTSALVTQDTLAQGSQIIDLLRQPLLLNTSDYKEQIDAASADLRAAQADVQAANADLIASHFEAASVDMIYQAAQLEVTRQGVLKDVADIQAQVSGIDQQVAAIDQTNATTDAQRAAVAVQKAQLLDQKAQKQLAIAQRSRAGVREQIKLLQTLLHDPAQAKTPDGQVIGTFPGSIAANGARLEFAISQKLSDDLDEAQQQLDQAIAADLRRRELESQHSLIKGLLAVAGGIVGFVVGGPVGAAVGAAAGAAIGDLVNNITDKKPAEEVVVGLVSDTFKVSQAAGVDLSSKLGQLGDVVGDDATQLLKDLDSSIQPLLDNLPRAIDLPNLADAVRASGLGDQITSALAGLRATDVGSVLAQAGITDPVIFTDPQELLNRVSAKLLQTVENDLPGLSALAAAAGISPDDLTRPGGAAAAAERVAKLLLARVGLASGPYLADSIRRWAEAKKAAGQSWGNAIAKEAETLLGFLVADPNARATVEANLKLALLDLKTYQGEIQSFLDPWQKELNKRVDDVTRAGQSILDHAGNDPLALAHARVDYVQKSLDQFQSNLLPYLKGRSDERTALVAKLNDLGTQDLDKADQVTLAQIDFQAAGLDITSANQALQVAQNNVTRAGDLVQRAELQTNSASLMVRVAQIGQQQASLNAQSQAQAAQAAEAKTQASAARLDAAKAAVDAAKARLAGALKRGAEASRIRSVLSLPPLRLASQDVTAGTIAFAAVRHADALEEGLRASREILRLLRSAQVPPSRWPAPDAKFNDPTVQAPWSDSLADQAQKFVDFFRSNSSPSIQLVPLTIAFGPKQLAALTGPSGLKVFLRPGLTLSDGDALILRNIPRGAALNGQVIAVIFEGTGTTAGADANLDESNYLPSAIYRGDRWLSDTEVHLVDLQNLFGARIYFARPGSDPGSTLVTRTTLLNQQGQPDFAGVPGTPVSGTTVLRLDGSQGNPIPVKTLQATILFGFLQ